jgi:hypothetical protein
MGKQHPSLRSGLVLAPVFAVVIGCALEHTIQMSWGLAIKGCVKGQIRLERERVSGAIEWQASTSSFTSNGKQTAAANSTAIA